MASELILYFSFLTINLVFDDFKKEIKKVKYLSQVKISTYSERNTAVYIQKH